MTTPRRLRPMRRRRGFTLLELILASGMISVLALSLYASLRVAFRARDSAMAAIGPARAGELAIDMVRRDLESALPPTGVIAGAFFGETGVEVPDSGAVEFYIVAPPSPAALQEISGGTGGTINTGAYSALDRRDPTAFGGIQRVRLLVRRTEQGETALVRQVERNLMSPSTPEVEEEVLARGVQAFTLSYYDGYQWYDAWDSTTQGNVLPTAVEVTLDLTPPADTLASRAAAAAPATAEYVYRATRVFHLPCARDGALEGT